MFSRIYQWLGLFWYDSNTVCVLGWDKIKASAVPQHKTSMKSCMPVCQSTPSDWKVLPAMDIFTQLVVKGCCWSCGDVWFVFGLHISLWHQSFCIAPCLILIFVSMPGQCAFLIQVWKINRKIVFTICCFILFQEDIRDILQAKTMADWWDCF